MLPRKTQISQLVGLAMFACLGFWLWVQTPLPSPGDVIMVNSQLDLSHLVTRRHTVQKAADEPKVSHRHSLKNETLLKLQSNMTLNKANKSEVRAIMQQMERRDVTLNTELAIDESHAVNPHPFKYIINNRDVCKDKDTFLIVYVHTAPAHHKRRSVIRQTWGNPANYPDVKVRVLFIMGRSFTDRRLQGALEYEASLYRDIVQEDFKDTYKNLTYKGIAALKWITLNCRHAKFVLKSDDDIFVNMFTLLRHLVSLNTHGTHTKKLILCLVWYSMPVMRSGKWKVSEKEWKDKYYPTYCSGSAFTLSTDVAVNMYKTSLHVPFFWVDDFYITGLLPLKMGKEKAQHKQFMSTYILNGNKLREKFNGPQWFTYIFSHVHNLNLIQSVWRRLQRLHEGREHLAVPYALPGQLPKITPTPKPTPKPVPKTKGATKTDSKRSGKKGAKGS